MHLSLCSRTTNLGDRQLAHAYTSLTAEDVLKHAASLTADNLHTVPVDLRSKTLHMGMTPIKQSCTSEIDQLWNYLTYANHEIPLSILESFKEQAFDEYRTIEWELRIKEAEEQQQSKLKFKDKKNILRSINGNKSDLQRSERYREVLDKLTKREKQHWIESKAIWGETKELEVQQ